MNHGHRRQCVGPRKVAMEAGRPRDAAALARTDLSPHFFCQITGDYIRIVSAFDTRESPKQRFLAGVKQAAKRDCSMRHATRFRGRAMDACRQMRYPAGLLFRRVLRRCAPVAQWIEYCPPKAGVAGSIPAGRAKCSIPAPSCLLIRPCTAAACAEVSDCCTQVCGTLTLRRCRRLGAVPECTSGKTARRRRPLSPGASRCGARARQGTPHNTLPQKESACPIVVNS